MHFVWTLFWDSSPSAKFGLTPQKTQDALYVDPMLNSISILSLSIIICVVMISTSSAFLPIRSCPQSPNLLTYFATSQLKINSAQNKISQPPFELQHIDHVVIRCKNFDSMFDFYHRILGCTIDEPTSDHLNRFGGALTHLRAGSCYIDLMAYDTEHLSNDGKNAVAKMHAGGQGTPSLNGIIFSSDTSTMDHLCLRVGSFDEMAMVNYLANENVEMVVSGGDRLGADGVGRSIYIRDPEGNVIELKGPPYKFDAHENGRLGEQQILPDYASKNDVCKINTEKISALVQPKSDVPDESVTQVSNTPCTRICRYNSSFYDRQVCIGLLSRSVRNKKLAIHDRERESNDFARCN